MELALFILLAVVLGVAGLWLLYCGILFDRARGVARCGRCWYPLVVVERAGELQDAGVGTGGAAVAGEAAIQPATCAECGMVHTVRAQTLRTRRSKARIGLGVVLLTLALVAPMVPGVRANGLWPSLPEWAVYASARVVGPGSAAWRELERRVLADTELPRRTWEVSREMIGASIVHTRSVWPMGTKPRIDAPRLLTPFMVKSVDAKNQAVTARLETEPSALSGFRDLPSHEVYWQEPTLPVDHPDGVAEDATQWKVAIAGLMSTGLALFFTEVTWTFDADVHRIITPQSGAALDEAVRGYLAPTLIRGMTTRLPAVSMIRGGMRPVELKEIALGLRITIQRGEEVAATGWCWHAGDASRPNGRADMPPVVLSVTTGDFELSTAFGELSPANVPGPEWTITIESDSVLALRDFKATKCWKGKVSWPLAEVMMAR